MSEENTCDLCNGKGSFNGVVCAYCNGTGEWNAAAQSYMNNHICQCILWDRQHCPVCKKKCHHDTGLNPKQVIDPGYDGMDNGGHSFAEPVEQEVIII